MFTAKEIIGNAMALSAGCVGDESEADYLDLLNSSIRDLETITDIESKKVVNLDATVDVDGKYYAVLSYLTAAYIACRVENLALAAFYHNRAMSIIDDFNKWGV
jgi:hypothetical protein